MLTTRLPSRSLRLAAVSRSFFPNLFPFGTAAEPACAPGDPTDTDAASVDPQMQKLDRIASELVDLNKVERRDYAILFKHKLDLKRFVPGLGVHGLGVGGGSGGEAGAASPDRSAAGAEAPVEPEKTTFDIKLEKIEGNGKLKVVKELRTFTDLGVKEAKELVEKAPVVLKKGVVKEEADQIAQKLKAMGAVVVLE